MKNTLYYFLNENVTNCAHHHPGSFTSQSGQSFAPGSEQVLESWKSTGM
jgi:hypothetical protein